METVTLNYLQHDYRLFQIENDDQPLRCEVHMCTWDARPLTPFPSLAARPCLAPRVISGAGLGQQIPTMANPLSPFTPRISPIPLISGKLLYSPRRIKDLGHIVGLTVAVPGVDLPPLELEVEEPHVGLVRGVVVQLVWGR